MPFTAAAGSGSPAAGFRSLNFLSNASTTSSAVCFCFAVRGRLRVYVRRRFNRGLNPVVVLNNCCSSVRSASALITEAFSTKEKKPRFSVLPSATTTLAALYTLEAKKMMK
ncbi:hypothetical protein KCP71_08050 [Salmonella enterica subsp. enterica]|nr:hypothetical protein KCP71_08050 [Salmonella enterica subsp. enterica]